MGKHRPELSDHLVALVGHAAPCVSHRPEAYGAKGGGEASLNSMAANIANAVDRAVGVRIRQAPLTPERVWRALKDKKIKDRG